MTGQFIFRPGRNFSYLFIHLPYFVTQTPTSNDPFIQSVFLFFWSSSSESASQLSRPNQSNQLTPANKSVFSAFTTDFVCWPSQRRRRRRRNVGHFFAPNDICYSSAILWSMYVIQICYYSSGRMTRCSTFARPSVLVVVVFIPVVPEIQ